jgi:hypothetical protein
LDLVQEIVLISKIEGFPAVILSRSTIGGDWKNKLSGAARLSCSLENHYLEIGQRTKINVFSTAASFSRRKQLRDSGRLQPKLR